MARSGKLGETAGSVIEAIQPEAVYFTAQDGVRGGHMVVNLNDVTEMPRIAEPLFLAFDAKVEFEPAMVPEDLMRASGDIEAAVKRFG